MSFVAQRSRARLFLAFAAVSSVVPPAMAQDALPNEAGREAAEDEENEEIIVQATRSNRRVQDEPVRVEVIGQEEIEEKALMRPGNIAMVLSETGGLRVQITSPALGASNIRVQGMEGRYTQLLSDGLPLYGGQASSLGLLQIPPTDLGQVEVIKGSASALYGPSALGGVINLVSRRPGSELEADFMANVTSRNGQDLTAYGETPLSPVLSASLTAGLHRQTEQDLDGDGWLDMPGYERWTIRPRLFFEHENGATAYLTIGAMGEDRVGGTLPGRVTPDGNPFPQTQRTNRLDGGLVTKLPVPGLGDLHFRASAMGQDHRHQFGTVIEVDEHSTAFAEVSTSGSARGTSWVGGLAYQVDAFRSATFPVFDYTYRVPGIFAQIEQELGPLLTLATSARVDFHNEYGTHFSPRFSALYRPAHWTVRLSAGKGFFAPTPFVEEIEAAGLSRLEPLGSLQAETATTASLDVGYRRGPVELNGTLFGSNLKNTTRLEQTAPDRVQLVNDQGTTKVRGAELLARYRNNGFTLTGSYVLIDTSEPEPSGAGRRTVPLTPRHTGGLVGMWEEHDKGRVGVELYYTGKQDLDDNPYRSQGKPYVELGMMGEIVLGKVRLFLNAENLLNVRQTRYDPLLLPVRAADGRWTVDGWAPNEGRVINGGIRFKLGGTH